MYTITVKIAANGTIYHSNETSVTGHMWYSISDGTSTESHGFAPLESGSPMGDGWVYPDDDANYGSTYYTGTIVKDINNDGQITSGKEVVGNHMTLLGVTKAADTIQALKTFDINHDGKIDSTDNSGLSFWTDRNHNGMTDVGELEALGASGAIQTIKLNPYQTLLSGYDNNHDGVINSNDKLYDYLYIQTNADDSVTLYLPDNTQAKEMIAGYTGGESIQTPQGEKIIKTIQFYSGYEMSLNDELNGTDGSETLEGSNRSETMRGKGGRDIIEAGAGDDTLEGGTQSDKLMGGEGNDTYIYNRGDGKDTIIDSGGLDTLEFGEGISTENIIVKASADSNDLIIALKEVDNIKKCFYLFSNDICHINIKNRNLLKKAA